MTADLIAFLRTRLDEDGERAESLHDLGCGVIRYDGTCDCGWPPQVLAEVDAKRMLLAAFTTQAEMYARATEAARQPGRNSDALEALGHASARAALGTVLRDFAAVYADHPDYRPEWAPDACRKGEA